MQSLSLKEEKIITLKNELNYTAIEDIRHF